MKMCSRCKQQLPFEKFHKDRRLKSGLRSYCTQCANQYRKPKSYVRMPPVNKEYYRYVGKRIRYAREYKGLSRSQLGKLILYHEDNIRNWETSRHSVHPETVRTIAQVLEVDLLWLLYGDDKEENE